MGEKPLSYYFNLPGAPQLRFPFPGNGIGKLWHCPSAKSAASDVFLQSGSFGFFSHVMNLDLKLKSDICANGVVGNSAVYPNMPKLSTIRMPSATVLLAEVAFSPTLETYVGSSASRNGIFPAARWTYFSKRHNDRGVLVFLDGHSAMFTWKYVYNANPSCSRVEVFNADIWWNPNRDVAKP
jgi:prepilin-type processing-associated H-X9-DG protein